MLTLLVLIFILGRPFFALKDIYVCKDTVHQADILKRLNRILIPQDFSPKSHGMLSAIESVSSVFIESLLILIKGENPENIGKRILNENQKYKNGKDTVMGLGLKNAYSNFLLFLFEQAEFLLKILSKFISFLRREEVITPSDINISMSGVSIKTDFIFLINEKVTLSLQLTEKSPMLEIPCKVIWIKKGKAGLEFYDLYGKSYDILSEETCKIEIERSLHLLKGIIN